MKGRERVWLSLPCGQVPPCHEPIAMYEDVQGDFFAAAACTPVPLLIINSMLQIPSSIRAVICDVDGSWSSSLMWYGPQGESLKPFHVRDGHRMVAARRAGLVVGVCSGRESAPLQCRVTDLGLSPLFFGVADKVACLQAWCADSGVSMSQICMVGDDEPDRELIGHVGCFVAPADADPRILRRAHQVSRYSAGQGVVAEVLESWMRQHGHWPPSSTGAVL
ncbi:MAG: phenylphosphate carboxylase subunit delta [Planctomycetota bacterium]|nr:MAG: phenylphosphate carboxylase subunit delta [Planctomycetota bacterium]